MALGNAGREARALRVMVWIAFAIVLGIDIAYLLLIGAQQPYPPDAFTVPFVAAFLVLMAGMLGLSLLNSAPIVRLRPALRAGAAGGLLVIGVHGRGRSGGRSGGEGHGAAGAGNGGVPGDCGGVWAFVFSLSVLR